MKNALFPFLFLPLLAACGGELPPGPEPLPGFEFDISMTVSNSLVGNMLDPAYRDEILACGVTAEYNGKTYPLQWPEAGSVTETRSEAADSKGFRVEPLIPGVDETLVLKFGKLEPGLEGFRGETLVIDWGDCAMSGDEVTFDYYFTFLEGGERRIVEQYRVNGEEQPDDGNVNVALSKPVYLPITDYANLDINMFVKNAAGENLLDPDVEGNILDNDISVEYDGEVWPLEAPGTTRATEPAEWKGLRIEPYTLGDASPVLKLGEFDPTYEFRGETFTIDWGDGSMSCVTFDCYVTHGEISPVTGKIVSSDEWVAKIWVDGELLSDGLRTDGFAVEIVK